MEANGNIRTLTINKSNLSDDAAYECVVGEDKCSTEVYVKGASSPNVYRLSAIIHWKLQPRNTMKQQLSPNGSLEPPITITKLMDDYHVVVGERVEFEIEVSEEGAHVMWSGNAISLMFIIT